MRTLFIGLAIGLVLTALLMLAGSAWNKRVTDSGDRALTDRLDDVAFQLPSHVHAPTRRSDTSKLAPSKPMSVLTFVEPRRYVLYSGETVRVSLTLVASEATDRVMVSARTESGAEVVSKPQYFLGALSAGQQATVWFDVTVLAEGKHYLTVVAQAETPDGTRLSSYAVPVETRTDSAQPKSVPESRDVFDGEGNRLRLLPAHSSK